MDSIYSNSGYSLYVFYSFILLFLLYKLSTWTFNLDRKYGLRGPKPMPLLGNTLQFIKHGFHVCDVENQRKFGHIYPVYQGLNGSLVVSDEEMMRQVLVKEFKSFTDRPAVRGNGRLMKQNLIRLNGKSWERVRALVTPIFSSGKLKKMHPMIVSSVNGMMDRFRKVENSNVDTKQLFNSLTMDVIAKTMFGIEIQFSEENSHSFINYGRKLIRTDNSNIPFLLLNLFPSFEIFVDYFRPNGIVAPASIAYFRDTLAVTIDNRKQHKEEYHDFLALMLNAHDELIKSQNDIGSKDVVVPSKGLTEEEIMAQSIIFLLAGFETTASTLTFCSYFLAMNQDAQNEVYQELMENISDEEEVTYDMLTNLKILEQCLNETLRISPPVMRTARFCTSDVNITSSTGQVFQIKKGMRILIPIYAIHHDERIWPDPYKFNLHRFDKEETKKRSQFAFLPFGFGPRICVGMRFAMLEAKLALANLLKVYKLVPCDQTPKELSFKSSPISSTKEPIIIRLEKRVNS